MNALGDLKIAAQNAARRPRLRTATASRWLSTSRPTLRAPNIYVSDSHDPWFNLAFEDWIFRKTDPEERILYMYRNSPSVIIGRNQNPWKEINLARLRELGIPFVRRKSGGGTVYHDLGNTNYCIFVPRTEFDRKTNAELVTRGLNQLDIDAYVNDRNDICVDGFKVSGSAFKLVNKRAYHHGTMLIDAKLGDLRGVLGSQRESMVTKGVASVPSPVKNLNEFAQTKSGSLIDHEDFVRVVTDDFATQYGVEREIKRVTEAEAETNSYVREVVDELKSWEWQYGQTPEFSHDISGSLSFGSLTVSIQSRHGLITSADMTEAPADPATRRRVSELCQLLIDDRYESLERTRTAIEAREGQEREQFDELVSWLQREM